jgi:hypothetical protein
MMASSLDNPLDEEHRSLMHAAQDLTQMLRGIDERYAHGDVHHYQHTVFAERADGLGRRLQSVLGLIRSADYPGAFTLLRAALEHQLFDQLLFRGAKYTYAIDHVSQEDWVALEPTLQGPDLVRAELNSGRVTVVRSGVHFKGEGAGPDAMSLSVYYHYLENYRPFLGHPKQQAYFAPEHAGLARQEAWAKDQQSMYGSALKWPALQRNLEINQIYSDKDLFRLDVHFRFHSAFVHPSTDQDEHLYGRNVRRGDLPRYDHFSSELGLLYILWIGASELRALEAMSKRAPQVSLEGWVDVQNCIRVADTLSAYGWFPGQDPQFYDRVQEANGRIWADAQNVIPEHPVIPEQLSVEEIGYYRDPLQRLIRLHLHVHDLMGFSYVSAWPRSDARHR